jgi:hypothetical protein
LFKKDSQLGFEFADLQVSPLVDTSLNACCIDAYLQVTLFAEFATHRLIDYLRASTSYNLEAVRRLLKLVTLLSDTFQAYNECKNRDLVSEMVFLLGRMGNNKKALTLIIERLGDVHMVRE